MQGTPTQRKCQNRVHLSDFCMFTFFPLIFSEYAISYSCFASSRFSGTKNAVRGMTIGIALAIFSAFTGLSVFITYAVSIFQSANTNLDAYVCSIVIGIMQILGCLCSTQLSDTLGRKIMLITSFLGTFIGTTVLIIFLYVPKLGYDVSAYTWIPVTSLSFVIFILSAGINPLLGVCTVENLPTKVCMAPGTFKSIFSRCCKIFVFDRLIDMFPIILMG